MNLDHEKLITNFKNHSSAGGFVSRHMIAILSALKFETSTKSISHFNNDVHASLKYFSETFLELKKLHLALIFKKKGVVFNKNDSFSNPISINKNLVKDLNALMGINPPKDKAIYSELNPSDISTLVEYVEGQLQKIYFL